MQEAFGKCSNLDNHSCFFVRRPLSPLRYMKAYPGELLLCSRPFTFQRSRSPFLSLSMQGNIPRKERRTLSIVPLPSTSMTYDQPRLRGDRVSSGKEARTAIEPRRRTPVDSQALHAPKRPIFTIESIQSGKRTHHVMQCAGLDANQIICQQGPDQKKCLRDTAWRRNWRTFLPRRTIHTRSAGSSARTK